MGGIKSIVARHAGVSREFINSDPDLGRLIETAARQRRHSPPQNRDDTTVGARRRRIRPSRQKISQQKTLIDEPRSTIEELRRQRQLHLGSQLIASAIDPDTHARLQLDHDRLAAENANLQRRLAEKEGLTADFREDLAASR